MAVYVPKVSKELLPKIKKRFADFGMDCDFHPKFEFTQGSEDGFVPVRMKVKTASTEHYKNMDMITGFELDIEDFYPKSDMKDIK